MDVKIKKSSHYVLPPSTLQDIAWIYHMSLLVRYLKTYCWKTWAHWYQDKIIITTTKTISDNIVYMTKQWRGIEKKHLERCKLHDAQRIKFPEAGDKKECNKVKPTKQNTNYFYLLLSMRISKVFYLNKIRVGHRHQNPSSPNTSITYHVEAAFMWNAVMSNTLNQPK